ASAAPVSRPSCCNAARMRTSKTSSPIIAAVLHQVALERNSAASLGLYRSGFAPPPRLSCVTVSVNA
ncbi:MAG: hypothetical protein ACT60Q_09930, partial [Ferrovibrionaceae bacterium]